MGRLVPLKGYDVLLRALALLRAQIPARLVLVGDGESRGDLESLTATLGLTDCVYFTGWEGNPWRYMARADALALSSRTEAYPSVITEALHLGVPVVASECSTGVRECLNGGKAGLLVPPDSPTAMAEALARILTQPALRAQFRAEGERFVAPFDLPLAVARYEDAILDVLRERRGREITPRDDLTDVSVASS